MLHALCGDLLLLLDIFLLVSGDGEPLPEVRIADCGAHFDGSLADVLWWWDVKFGGWRFCSPCEVEIAGLICFLCCETMDE